MLVEVEREATAPWFSEALEIVVRGPGLRTPGRLGHLGVSEPKAVT